MPAKLRFRRPSHGTVVAYLALFVALGGTGAYAANEWTGTNIVDSSLTGADVRGKAGTSSVAAVNGSLTTDDIAGQRANAANGTPFVDGTLTQWDVKNGSIASVDLAGGAVTTAKVADNNLTGADLLDSTVRSADIAPLTITGFDIGFNAIEDVHVLDNTLTEFDIDEARLFQCHGGAVLFGRLCAGGGAVGNLGDALNLCGSIGLRLPSWGEAYLLGRNHDVPGVGAGERFWTSEITNWTDGGSLPVVVTVNEDGGALTAGGSANQHKIVCVETPTGLP